MRKNFKLCALRFNSTSGGFTLIELLTVIAIIGVLMAFLTVSFVGVKKRSTDAQRKSDLSQIKSALELYKADNDTYAASIPSCGSAFTGSGGTLYMQKVPCDPKGGSYSYIVSPSSSPAGCTLYQLAAQVENAGDTDPNIYRTTINNVTGKFYILCNP